MIKIRNKIEYEKSLLCRRPDLAKQWDYTRNQGMLPEDYSVGSGEKVYWLCEKGHSYVACIYQRTGKSNSGCPYCSRRKAIIGETDLATLRPDIVAEWDYQKNGNKKPQDYTVSSGAKVFWLCPYKHSYRAAIAHRTEKKPTGCPVCANKTIVAGVNDLKTLRPDIATEWDYENNGNDGPDTFSVGSAKKVYWVCMNGHSYKAKISNRTSVNHTGCPYCYGRKAIIGETDLATMRPDLAAEWDYEKNKGMTPAEFSPGSNKRAYWLCSKGHSFVAMINTRTGKNTGCPFCANQKPIKGENDLKTLRPDISDEWDYNNNKGRSPEDFCVTSHYRAFWICPAKHIYRTSISHRTQDGSKCPYCAGQRPIVGINDLAILRPDLAEEWNFDRNKKGPQNYMRYSHAKVWWICSECGYEWKAWIDKRSIGRGCPKCNR